MSYTKHTWANGEIVTSVKMNNIEDGIDEALSGGGGSDIAVFTYANSVWTCNKTYAEMSSSVDNRTFDAVCIVQGVVIRLNSYTVSGSGEYANVYLRFLRENLDSSFSLEYYNLHWNYEMIEEDARGSVNVLS